MTRVDNFNCAMSTGLCVRSQRTLCPADKIRALLFVGGVGANSQPLSIGSMSSTHTACARDGGVRPSKRKQRRSKKCKAISSNVRKLINKAVALGFGSEEYVKKLALSQLCLRCSSPAHTVLQCPDICPDHHVALVSYIWEWPAACVAELLLCGFVEILCQT